MTDSSERSGTGAGGISVRSVEIGVALLLILFGGLVLFDSVRLGSRWGADGPEAGYFPFYIGLIICLSAGVILAQALFGRVARERRIFVEWQPLRRVMAVLVPAAFFVLGIQLVGLYIAAALYIAGFMMWLGQYGWVRSVVLALSVSVLAFFTFEIWFQIPLYKGAFNPLAFLGY